MAIILLTGQAMDTTLSPNENFALSISPIKTMRRNETKL